MPRSKNAWSYTSTPQYFFMAWCSVKKSTGTTLPLPLQNDIPQVRYTREAGVGLVGALEIGSSEKHHNKDLREYSGGGGGGGEVR
jgi:hypothetical protein